MTGDRHDATSIVARYDALIRVSEALRAYHDRDTLFRSLARELRPVVRFSFLGLGLYDEQTHTVSGTCSRPPANRCRRQLSAEESVAYWVVQHQEPLVFPFVEAETRFPQAIAYLRSQGMQSTCSLPLTTPRRRLGMLLQAAGNATLRRRGRGVSVACRESGCARHRERGELRGVAALARARARPHAERRGVRRTAARVVHGPRHPAGVSASLADRRDRTPSRSSDVRISQRTRGCRAGDVR